MAGIKPEDFKKNLEFFKTLDNNLQKALTRYDYNLLFKSHDNKYFERVKAADNFNRWALEKDAKVLLDESVRYWGELSDETYSQVTKNIELVKEIINADVYVTYLLNDILGSRDVLYTDFCAKLKSELGDNFNYSYLSKLWYNRNDITPTAALIDTLGKDADKLSGWDFESICSQYYKADDAGKRNFLAKIDIAGKMPQFRNYNNNFSKELLKSFMERDIANAEKIAEFVNLAEPNFLSKIGFQGYSYYPIIAFEKLFEPQNLDNMIACAKLHKDLPEDFAEFLHSEQSIIGSSRWSGSNVENYQYMVTPDELASRIETIKKYNGKLAPNLLERIYNGELTAKTPSLDMLSTIDQQFWRFYWKLL